MDELVEFYGPPISVYTRAQAVEEGVLVDVSEWASPRQMMGGFLVPVAMTRALFTALEKPSKRGEDLRGRAHDVLWMALLAGRRHQEELFQGDPIPYVVLSEGRKRQLQMILDGDGIVIGLAEEDLS